MEKMIRWLIEIETMSGEVYAQAADLLEEDRTFAAFLRLLAKDEKMHQQFMKSALTCFRKTPQIKTPFSVDRKTRETVEAPFRKVIAHMAAGTFSRSSIMECIVTAEHSEWNDIFLFVINTLKHHCSEFVKIGPTMQHHLRHIERHMETLEEGRTLINHIRNLPPVWRERMLVVDDEAAIVDLLSAVLSREGGVDTASNGREALEMALSHYYAVIISDIDMPEMDGITFYKRLQARYGDVGRRFVFFTGNLDGQIGAFMTENHLRLLNKPAPLSVIRQTVFDIMALNSAPLGKNAAP